MTSSEKRWADWHHAMLAGQYFEAHDVLEELWRVSHDGRQQVLIWVAAAFYHWRRANWIGADRLLRKSLARIEDTGTARTLETQLRAWIEGVMLNAVCPGLSKTSADALVSWARPIS